MGNTITAEGVRRIAMEQIIEAGGDWAADVGASPPHADVYGTRRRFNSCGPRMVSATHLPV